MAALAAHFDEGGWGMYWVLACSVVLVARGLSAAVLLFPFGPPAAAVLEALDRRLASGDLGGGATLMIHTRGAVARLALVALQHGIASPAHIEAAIAAVLLDERAAIARVLPAFRHVANVATLCGLLGTIHGLCGGFHSVGNTDAESRAAALAAGLSASLHCTAFGLLVSTAALALGSLFHARAEALEAELSFASTALLNRLVDRRAQLRWLGARAPLERASYREAS